MKLSKSEALAKCQVCKNKSPTCKFKAIKSIQTEFLENNTDIPACILSQIGFESKEKNHHQENDSRTVAHIKNDSSNGESEQKLVSARWSPQHMQKMGSTQVVVPKKKLAKIDEKDKKILLAINNGYNQNGTSKVLDIPRTTVQRRIKKMQNCGLLSYTFGTVGWTIQKQFTLAIKGKSHIVHNEEQPIDSGIQKDCTTGKVYWHCVSYKSEILSPLKN